MKLNLLLVDDNKTFLEALKFLLSDYNYINIIGETEDGIEAIKLTNKVRPDVILMDIQMPAMNGLETAKKILENDPTIKIIAITMNKELAYLENYIMAGFRACIFKSNVAAELMPTLQAVLNDEYRFPHELKISKGLTKKQDYDEYEV